MLRALEEANVPVDVVGGASIGAIIGAGYAAGWSISEMTQVYRASFIAENPLSDWTLPFVSLVGGRAVSRLLKEAYGRRDIEDLVKPFFCVSTNLTAGSCVVHRSGRLWKWLRASAAIPGVLPPVFQGGQVFVDGGVMNNLPVDVMRDALVDDVIAVDIGADNALLAPGKLDEFELPSMWRVVWDWFTGTAQPLAGAADARQRHGELGGRDVRSARRVVTGAHASRLRHRPARLGVLRRRGGAWLRVDLPGTRGAALSHPVRPERSRGTLWPLRHQASEALSLWNSLVLEPFDSAQGERGCTRPPACFNLHGSSSITRCAARASTSLLCTCCGTGSYCASSTVKVPWPPVTPRSVPA